MNSNQSFSIIIVEKSGNIKQLQIKDFKQEDLFKKCGFKKADDFLLQTEWKIKLGKIKWLISVFGKTEGRANNENKFDFPPPIDTKLFFGNCAILAKSFKDGSFSFENLTIDLWEKMYEKLFGGFEDLAVTAKEDEEEEDELANIPKEKKTSDGYLKDGFVVSSDSDSFIEDSGSSDQEDDLGEDLEETDFEDIDQDLEDSKEIGSELSEEDYD